MKKVIYLSLIALCTFTLQVNAQHLSVNPETQRYAHTQKKFTFAVQPFQLFNNSLRYDFEIRLGKGPGWLQIGPAFYFKPFDEREQPDYNYNEGGDYYHQGIYLFREPYSGLKGSGLDLNYKHFLDPRRSFYIAAGVTYAHFNIKYWTWTWDDYIEDGLQYFTNVQAFRTQQIDRFGVNNFIGFQIPSRHAFLFDVFGGYALRFADSDKNQPAFNRFPYSYGYSGIVFLMGVRFGFGIR